MIFLFQRIKNFRNITLTNTQKYENVESVQKKNYTLWILLGICAVLVGFVVLLLLRLTQKSSSDVSGNKQPFQFLNRVTGQRVNSLSQNLSGGLCTGEGTTTFISPPMHVKDIGSIIPLGLMVGSHVTPIDHIYFSPKNFQSARDTYEVLAIADGTIVDIQHRTQFVGDNPTGKETDEYRLVVEYTCTFYSYYDLVTSLTPEILKQAGDIDKRTSRQRTRIPIKAGQVIGKIGGQTLDFAVWNTDVTLNFIVPEHYNTEPWKIHTDDPFKYFREPIKSEFLALDLRQTEPRQGKIDYDIDGKLVGNWFKAGTDGYGGWQNGDYWNNHLSIVYDHLDPTQIRISIGGYEGDSRQFGVKGNTPDPKEVGVGSSTVKYELQQYDYYVNGKPWDRFTPGETITAANSPQVLGVVLVEMVDDRKIKFETFPHKTALEVKGFTSKVVVYER